MNLKVVTGTFAKAEYAQLQSANTLVVIEIQVIHGRDIYKNTRQPIQGLRTLIIYLPFPNFEYRVQQFLEISLK